MIDAPLSSNSYKNEVRYYRIPEGYGKICQCFIQDPNKEQVNLKTNQKISPKEPNVTSNSLSTVKCPINNNEKTDVVISQENNVFLDATYGSENVLDSLKESELDVKNLPTVVEDEEVTKDQYAKCSKLPRKGAVEIKKNKSSSKERIIVDNDAKMKEYDKRLSQLFQKIDAGWKCSL